VAVQTGNETQNQKVSH
jgi:hypothetical protein